MCVAVPDTPLRAAALRWIVTHLAAVQLQQGALAEAAGYYKQLITLDAAALEGKPLACSLCSAGSCCVGWAICSIAGRLACTCQLS